MLPAATVASAVFVMARSALVLTVVAAVDTLFPPLGSVVPLATVAVLEKTVPLEVVGSTVPTRENTAVAPLINVPQDALDVPPPATAAVGPEVCVKEANVMPAGKVSLTFTLTASLGPLLVTVMV